MEGSYAQRHLVIITLHWLIHLHGSEGIQSNCRKKNQSNFFVFYLKKTKNILIEKLKLYSFAELMETSSLEYLLNCLWDTYEDIRQYSLEILIQLNVSFDFFDR